MHTATGITILFYFVVYADNIETIHDGGSEKKDYNGGGTVYVRWGHDQCPSTAQLVYYERAGGSHFNQPGGGSNPQCLPLDPNFFTPTSGEQYRAYIMELNTEHTLTVTVMFMGAMIMKYIPCAVCHVSNRTAVYMVPAKYTCPTGWTREYYGYLTPTDHELFITLKKDFCSIIIYFIQHFNVDY